MKNRGFTLIEMMIVVIVIGMLASIAIPAFTDFMHKSRRSDGITTLLALQQAQQRLRGNCKHYAEDLNGAADDCAATAADSQLKFSSTSSEGYYTINITAGSASANAYTATATAQGAQLSDNKCRTLILEVDNTTPDGARKSKDADGNATTECW